MSRQRTAYAAPAWAAEQKVGDVGTKATLLILANYADEDFSGFPSQARIAAETEQGERTVRRQLALLEELGLIVRQKRGSGGGGRTSDRFYLQLDVSVTDPQQVQDAKDRITARAEGYRPDCPVTPEGGYRPDEGGVTGQIEGGLPATGGRGTPSRTPSRTTPPPSPAEAPDHGAAGDGFDEMWEAYPRKTGKGQARKAYRTTITRISKGFPDQEPQAVLMQALQRFKATEWRGRAQGYIPHPSTWLNSEPEAAVLVPDGPQVHSGVEAWDGAYAPPAPWWEDM